MWRKNRANLWQTHPAKNFQKSFVGKVNWKNLLFEFTSCMEKCTYLGKVNLIHMEKTWKHWSFVRQQRLSISNFRVPHGARRGRVPWQTGLKEEGTLYFHQLLIVRNQSSLILDHPICHISGCKCGWCSRRGLWPQPNRDLSLRHQAGKILAHQPPTKVLWQILSTSTNSPRCLT